MVVGLREDGGAWSSLTKGGACEQSSFVARTSRWGCRWGWSSRASHPARRHRRRVQARGQADPDRLGLTHGAADVAETSSSPPRSPSCASASRSDPSVRYASATDRGCPRKTSVRHAMPSPQSSSVSGPRGRTNGSSIGSSRGRPIVHSFGRPELAGRGCARSDKKDDARPPLAARAPSTKPGPTSRGHHRRRWCGR